MDYAKPHTSDQLRSNITKDLQSRGHKSILDYLKRNQRKSYVELAKDFAKGTFAMQIIQYTFEEALLYKQFRWVAKDALVRELHEAFPKGWEKNYNANGIGNKQINFQKAKAYGIWHAMVNQVPTNAVSFLFEVWSALQRLNPPSGWLPEGVDDSFIAAAFDEEWPESTDIEYRSGEPEPILICPFCKADVPEPRETDVEQICPQCGMDWPII